MLLFHINDVIIDGVVDVVGVVILFHIYLIYIASV